MAQLTEWLKLMLAEIANRQQAALAAQQENERRSSDGHGAAEPRAGAVADVDGCADEAAGARGRVSAV